MTTTIEPAMRSTIIRAGLSAAGVPAELHEKFEAPTADIALIESGWNAAARAIAITGRGPEKFFGGVPSGLTQLTPLLFERYRAEGTSTDIFDPVASIAALWRFIADNFAVDLSTGTGVEEFHAVWRAHRQDWWWLTELAPFRNSQDVPGY